MRGEEVEAPSIELQISNKLEGLKRGQTPNDEKARNGVTVPGLSIAF